MFSGLFIPLLFVFLWSTGFIGSKLGAPYAEPATFLLVRMSITALILIVIVLWQRKRWPSRAMDFVHSAVVGVLLHGVYLGGVFYAISTGTNAGLSALVVGLQPVLTVALSAIWLGEPITGRKIAGLVAGFVGVALVIQQTNLLPASESGSSTALIKPDSGETLFGQGLINGMGSTVGLAMCFVALLAITIGTIYQKRFCTNTELLPGACIQYVAVTLFLLPFALIFETMVIKWSPTFIFALAWLILVLSLGAVFLLMILIKQGEAGRVSSLFYLVPPVVAIEAWILFNERLTLLSFVGMALCVFGVMLVVSGPQKQSRN